MEYDDEFDWHRDDAARERKRAHYNLVAIGVVIALLVIVFG